MARFWTSDEHFGHANIIRYCARPFDDVAHMNRVMAENWIKTVSEDDEVHILGDVTLGNLTEALAIVKDLPGRKTLYAGNHDQCWAGRGRRHHRFIERYMNEGGFDAILQGPQTAMVGKHAVLVSHFPYTGDSKDSDRHSEHRPIDLGLPLLHGHVHEKWLVKDRMINVGVDVWDFTPVHDDTLIQMLDNMATGVPS